MWRLVCRAVFETLHHLECGHQDGDRALSRATAHGERALVSLQGRSYALEVDARASVSWHDRTPISTGHLPCRRIRYEGAGSPRVVMACFSL